MVDLKRVGLALGWLLLRGVEAVLALGTLLTVWLLVDFAAMPDTGNPEAAATIGFALLFGWVTAAGLLALVAGGHALVGGLRMASNDGFDAVVDSLPRLAVETLVALGLFAVVPFGNVFSGGFLALVGGSFVLGVMVLFHVTADVVLAGRSVLDSSSSP